MKGNKFQDYIQEQGSVVGWGSERVAYEIPSVPNYVFKFPHEKNFQGEEEEYILKNAPEDFFCFIPEFEYFGRILKMEKIKTASTFNGARSDFPFFDFDPARDDYYEFMRCLSETSLGHFFIKYQIKFDAEKLFDFFCWLDEENIILEDLVNNYNNFGVGEDGALKFCDFGFSRNYW